MSYIEKGKTIDRDLHRSLVARRNKAEAEILKLIGETIAGRPSR
jgi:hypothetical protein